MTNKLEMTGSLSEFKDFFDLGMYQLNPAKRYTLTISELKRTNAQNNYYRMICNDIAEFFKNTPKPPRPPIQWGDRTIDFEWSGDMVHLWNKCAFGVNTTTRLNKQEFSEFMDKVFGLWTYLSRKKWEVPIPITEYFNSYGE